MTFENTYLMLLYFKNKKYTSQIKTPSRKATFNKDADRNTLCFDLENEIANYSLVNNNNSDETKNDMHNDMH